MTDQANSSEEIPFEQLLRELEEIVHRLEDGQLGLSESLASYEKGIVHLRRCHAGLEQAERRIELLNKVSTDGSVVSEPFDDELLSNDAKVDARSQRRQLRGPPPA
ncbi:MAG: exodeoxyribonuclease VII small subunit [Planctomycetes bacterium]|nr:exodeoxyribonuclease VII small subunit [Planctomycetota bacterium]